MTKIARRTVKDAVLWRGDQNLPVGQQGIRVLGVPIGQEEYIKNHLAKKSDEHQVLMDRIPLVQDLQAAWLLLFCCAGSRATFWLRSVRPQFTADFADAHDRQMWECFNQLMGIASFSAKAKQYITIPLSLGGVGLSSANRSRDSAHWSSWADSLPMIWNRHPVVATTMIWGLNARAIPTFNAVGECSDTLQNVGFTPPSWEDLAKGEPPPEEDVESEDDRNIPRGWQKASTKMVEQAYFSAKIQPQLTESEAALWRSQQGPLASVPFIVFPTNRATRIDPQPFRVLLCRRLHLPLPFFFPWLLMWLSS